jgi:hypothetical protein
MPIPLPRGPVGFLGPPVVQIFRSTILHTRRVSWLQHVYWLFSDRRVDGLLAMMTADVEWPDVARGTVLRGKDAIWSYWAARFAVTNSQVTPADFINARDDLVAVVTNRYSAWKDELSCLAQSSSIATHSKMTLSAVWSRSPTVLRLRSLKRRQFTARWDNSWSPVPRCAEVGDGRTTTACAGAAARRPAARRTSRLLVTRRNTWRPLRSRSPIRTSGIGPGESSAGMAVSGQTAATCGLTVVGDCTVWKEVDVRDARPEGPISVFATRYLRP